jgi:hypothetical protein
LQKPPTKRPLQLHPAVASITISIYIKKVEEEVVLQHWKREDILSLGRPPPLMYNLTSAFLWGQGRKFMFLLRKQDIGCGMPKEGIFNSQVFDSKADFIHVYSSSDNRGSLLLVPYRHPFTVRQAPYNGLLFVGLLI